ncbi:hypothetical protein DFP73DRAFT_597997 [Morchella snyderi]|nr:hypothetical protein DFP73DRAFT_597997 [Morchella snyderi]
MLQSLPTQSSLDPGLSPDPAPNPVPAVTPSAPAPVGAQGRIPVFRTFRHNLLWHFWTILSVTVAAVLISLNLIGHVIGPELGRTKDETQSVLKILLYIAKAHEIAIVLSLANLARQLIQSSLISKKGTILALVGAEQVTASPGVLVSKGYISALKYGFHYFSRSSRNEDKMARSRRRVVLITTGFLLVVGFLCATVGPSSAALMIPAQHWYRRMSLSYTSIRDDMEQSSLGIDHADANSLRPGHPYIFISPLDVRSSSADRWPSSTMRWGDVGTHWSNRAPQLASSYNKVQTMLYARPEDPPQVTHRFGVLSHQLAVNSSTMATSRPLTRDARWEGETKFETLMFDDVGYIGQGNITYSPTDRGVRASQTHFLAKITAITSTTTCRQKQKLSCGGSSTYNATNSNTKWCFQAPTVRGFSPQLFRSEDLLLLSEYPTDYFGQRDSNSSSSWVPRFHITEGPSLPSHGDFSDSILFVFEFAEDVVVCTNTASLASATATLAGRLYDVYQAEYHNKLVYQYSNKTTWTKDPKRFLFRKGWLDYEHSGQEVSISSYVTDPTTRISRFDKEAQNNISSTLLSKPRSERGVTKTADLRTWAEGMAYSVNRRTYMIWEPLSAWLNPDDLITTNEELEKHDMSKIQKFVESSTVEVAMGGPWISLLSLSERSLSQYRIINDNYTILGTDGTPVTEELFLPGSLIEKIDDYRSFVYPPVEVQHLLYGYSMGGVMSFFAAAVLITYMVVACCGSAWQLSRGGHVIIALRSVPEYLLLGESTATEMGRLGYTNVGGKDKTRFECSVRVDHAENGGFYGIKLG